LRYEGFASCEALVFFWGFLDSPILRIRNIFPFWAVANKLRLRNNLPQDSQTTGQSQIVQVPHAAVDIHPRRANLATDASINLHFTQPAQLHKLRAELAGSAEWGMIDSIVLIFPR
jgi:hypothetical protein